MTLSAETAHSRSWLAPDILCAGAYALVHTLLVFSWPAVPSQDAPLWVYEAELLLRAARGLAADGCKLVSALPPNALAQGVIAVLLVGLSPEMATRVYLAACVWALAAALVYLCRARDPSARSPQLLLALPLCAGYPFYHGFLNYLAALPVLAFGAGVLLRHPEGRGARGLLWLALLPTLTYLCHGTALGVWGLLVLVQLAVRRSRTFALRAGLGFVPVLGLALAYIAQRSSEGAAVTWTAGSAAATALYRLRSPLRFFSVFQGFTPTLDDADLALVAPLLVSVNLLYALGLTLGCVVWAVSARRSGDLGERFLALSVLALALAFVLMPHDVAQMLNPAERLLIPLACCGVAGLCRPSADALAVDCRRELRNRRLLLALLGAQCLYTALYGTRAAQAAREVAQARVRFGARSVQAQDIRGVSLSKPSGWAALLTRHQVLAMQGLSAAAHGGQAITPFATGLFRCQLQRALPHDLQGLMQSEQSLILLGESAQLQRLASLLAPAYRAVQTGSGYVVVQPAAAKR